MPTLFSWVVFHTIKRDSHLVEIKKSFIQAKAHRDNSEFLSDEKDVLKKDNTAVTRIEIDTFDLYQYLDVSKVIITSSPSMMRQLNTKIREMRRFCFDYYTPQALSVLHRYRAVMFSPTAGR